MMYSQSMRDALKEVEEYSEQPEEQLAEPLVGLIRTTAITINVAKGLQSGKKVQQHARKLRDIGNDLQRDKTPEDAQKTVGEGFRTLSELFLNMEEMIRRNSYVSASGGLFSDRTYNLLRKNLKKDDRRSRFPPDLNILVTNNTFRRIIWSDMMNILE